MNWRVQDAFSEDNLPELFVAALHPEIHAVAARILEHFCDSPCQEVCSDVTDERQPDSCAIQLQEQPEPLLSKNERIILKITVFNPYRSRTSAISVTTRSGE